MEFIDAKETFWSNEEYLDVLFSAQMAFLNSYYIEIAYDDKNEQISINPFQPSIYEVKKIFDRKLKTDDEVIEYINKWRSYIKSREEQTIKENEDIPSILLLFRKLELDDFAKEVLILSLMASFDKEIETLIKFFSGKYECKYPSLELYYNIIYASSNLTSFEKYSILKNAKEKLSNIFFNLEVSEFPFTEDLIPDKRLLSCILGEAEVFQHFVWKQEEENTLSFVEEEKNKLETYFKENNPSGVLLYGEEGSGKKTIVAECAGKVERNVCFITLALQEITEETLSLENKMRVFSAIREAIFYDTIPCILGLEKFNKQIVFQIIEMLNGMKKVYVCIFDKEEMPTGIINTMIIKLKLLDEFQRRDIWQMLCENYNISDDVNFTYIANTFLFTVGKIKNVLKMAFLDSVDSENQISKDAIYKACYALVDHKLAEKAKRVTTGFVWDDLKLPQREKTLLRDICNRVKNKHIVMTEWEFSSKLPYGSGISAVFAGPPGTGKTMAANIIANELNMQIYQIDLSQVVDKYIGETEKNIKLIFEQAKKSNSILFFDEADSLFAKRVDSKTSNDRFANIESSMLLQSVEQYSGIVILATNNYTSIDAAFIRRLKYLVNFTLPDESTRLDIWNSVFPKKVPISDEVNLAFYAKQFEFTGAYIKNIAVSASYIAAEENEEVNNFHLFTAISREMIKEGRKLDVSQMAQYGYMFEML